MVEATIRDLKIYEEETMKEQSYTFSKGKVSYGMDFNYVTKIIGLQDIVKVNGIHNNVKGIINFRDTIIPVIDAQIRLNNEHKQHNKACILVIEIKNILVGIIVNNSEDVINMDIIINYLVMMNLIKLN